MEVNTMQGLKQQSYDLYVSVEGGHITLEETRILRHLSGLIPESRLRGRSQK